MKASDCLLLFLSFLVLGCEGATPTAEPGAHLAEDKSWQDADLVQQHVRSLVDATGSGDVEKLVEFTHPKVIALMGGPVAAEKELAELLKLFDELGLEFEELSFPSPPEFHAHGEDQFVFVHTNSIMNIDGQRTRSINYQLGHRVGSAAPWKYIEGSQVNSSNIKEFFPNFPADVNLPRTHREKL